MKLKAWETIQINADDGRSVVASAPVIVSASRATDIPACHADWFMDCWRKGRVSRVNPFNGRLEYISFAKTRLIVFWSKNPAPLLKHLPELDSSGVNYYFQFTLNDYEKEGFEPGLPPLAERAAVFRELSVRIGKSRVIWRFDPMLMTRTLGPEELYERVARVAALVGPFSEKLVISFADILKYRKVQANLRRANVAWVDFTPDAMLEMGRRLAELKKQHGLEIATCAEEIDLAGFGIEHNRCVDDALMARLFSHDEALMSFLGRPDPGKDSRPRLKDKGQRKACGCIVSKDIGAYGTCRHMCVYCYANADAVARRKKPDEQTGSCALKSMRRRL